MDAWAPGAIVGEHRLGERLGKGGMGEVHLGVHVGTGARRAIKSLAGASDPELLLRFQREVEALARLDMHPHVVRVHAAGEALGRRYLVMDLASGGDLHAHLGAHGPLSPAAAVALGVALASGLSHAHARGILHRDLKPHNVLFDGPPPTGRPVLVDFGLARDQDARSLTATGELLGTPAYMAPEQARGDRAAIGPATDVYGLGATLFHALTGHPPFSGGSTLATLSKVLSGPTPSARALAPAVPVGLDDVLRRALAREPAERYPSAEAFARALEASLVVAPRRRGALLAASVVVVLAASAAVLVLAWRSFTGPATAATGRTTDPPPAPDLAPVATPDLSAPEGEAPAGDDLRGPLEGLDGVHLDALAARLTARAAELDRQEHALARAAERARVERRGGDFRQAGVERAEVARLQQIVEKRAAEVAAAREAAIAREAAVAREREESSWLEDPLPGGAPVPGEAPTRPSEHPLAGIAPPDLTAAPPPWISPNDPLRETWIQACRQRGEPHVAANVARLFGSRPELEARHAAAGWWRLVAAPRRGGAPSSEDQDLAGEAWAALALVFSGGHGVPYDASAALACLLNGKACGNLLAWTLFVQATIEGYHGLTPITDGASATALVLDLCRALPPSAPPGLKEQVALLVAARLRTAPPRDQEELRLNVRIAASNLGDQSAVREARLALMLLRDPAPGEAVDTRLSALTSLLEGIKDVSASGLPAGEARIARRVHADALALLTKGLGGSDPRNAGAREAARVELAACRTPDSELVFALLLLRERAPASKVDALNRLERVARLDPQVEGDAVHEARTLLHAQAVSVERPVDPADPRSIQDLTLESADAGWLPARRSLRNRRRGAGSAAPR